MVGVQVGPYRVASKLGAGGMGEVYRARDERLNRDVAIKVMPASMAADEDRLRRFTLEAQTTGALNHPNILTIYDVGTHRDDDSGQTVPYLAAELLEGETLRAKLDAGAIPMSKAIGWAKQCATGLAAAHAKGITHRDIKPENLFITTDGRLKILDFGLASSAGESREPRAESQTAMSPVLTEPGTVMGTAGYMSPEQVRARPADSRSDIFSLGVVLYEMLAGRRPFTGDSAVETMNAILTADPPELTRDASSGDRALPPAVVHVVTHCLEKNPEERFQSARDLAFALDALSSASSLSVSGIAAARPVPAAARATSPRWGLLAAALIVAAGLAVGGWLMRPAPGLDLSQYVFRAVATDPEPEAAPAWSPDGRTIAFVRAVDQRAHIFLRELDLDEPQQLTTGDASNSEPFWWPDSNRIGFIRDGDVLSMSRAGGDPQPVIADDSSLGLVEEAALSPDGRRLAIWATDPDERVSGLYFVALPDGAPERVADAPFEQACCASPTSLQYAPDGSSVLLSHFALYRGSGGPALWLVPVDGSPPREVFADAGLGEVPSIAWLPDGRHVLLERQGASAPVASLWLGDVETDAMAPITAGLTPMQQPTLSPDGSAVAFAAGGPDFDLVEIPIDRSEPVRNLLATSRGEHSAAWLAGERRFAYVTNRNGPEELRIRGLAGSDQRVTSRAAHETPLTISVIGAPAVSPDAQRIAYHVFGTGSGSAVWISTIRGGTPTRLYEEEVLQTSPLWSPDGGRVALWRLGHGLSVLTVGRPEAPLVLASDAYNTPQAAWSPDGNWIAYEDDDGLQLVSPDAATRRTLAGAADIGLAWSADSRTIYTIDGPRRVLVAVDAATGRRTDLRDLPADLNFSRPTNPSQGLSLSPDGTALLTTVARQRADIWILEGFRPPGRR